jgi:hypothetical protein
VRVIAAACVLLLSACAVLRPDAGEAMQVRDIVGAAVSGARASPDEQRRLVTHAQQKFAAMPDDANRVRLAALLATLPPPWRDEARAAAMLEPLAARRPETPLTQLAGMLAAGTAERQRLARDLRAAERREEAAEERAATLHQQVEALKSIERGILEREERRRATKR